MRVVVFGDDYYTAAVVGSLVEKGHTVQLMVTPLHKDGNYKVLEEASSKFGIELIKEVDINSDRVRNYLQRLKPELIVSAHLRKILKSEIFSLAAKGAINIHPSLLPKYRGLSPQHRAIMHGDKESGVTVHFIEEGVDTGEIIVQRKFPIGKDEYIMQVQQKMLAIYKEIAVEALKLIESGSFTPVKQDMKMLSYFGPLKKADREIDLSKPKQEIYNLVRAVSLPYKGAFYKNYTIWTATKPSVKDEAELAKKYPGTGFYYDKDAELVVMKLKDGYLVSDDFEIV